MLRFRLIFSRFNSKEKKISRNVRGLRLRNVIEQLKNLIGLQRRQIGWQKNLRSKGSLMLRNENGRMLKRGKGWRRRRLRSEIAVKKRSKRKFSVNKRSLRRLNVNYQRTKISLPSKQLQRVQKERKRLQLQLQLSKLKALVLRVSLRFLQQVLLNSNLRSFNKPISPIV